MVNKAVRVTKANGAVVETQSNPVSASDLDANEVLIKNVAVASNPKDWKMAHYGYEGIEGNDIAGYIEAVGADVNDFKKGDRVIAFTRMATGDKYGAYQPFSVAPAWTTAKLSDNVPLEDGATLPLAVTTAFVGLFDKLGLPEPTSEGQPGAGAEKINLLIWGASSSVGAYVTQLAKIAGFNIVAVAGAARDAVQSLGIDSSKIVDYRADRTQVIANINKAAGGTPFTHVYDAVTTKESTESIVELLANAPNKGGKFTTVLPGVYEAKDEDKQKGVTHDLTTCGAVHNDKKEFGERWLKTVVQWVEEGKLKPNTVQILEGGLDGVPAGLKLLEENKVSNRKLVARIADTKA